MRRAAIEVRGENKQAGSAEAENCKRGSAYRLDRKLLRCGE
jgi:hypothetical protein